MLLGDHSLHIRRQPQHFAQLALHGQRTFAALLATGYGDIMEALPRTRQEECIGILQCQVATHFGIGYDVAVAQLGQDHFQRLAKSVEYSNAMLQRYHAVALHAADSWLPPPRNENFACESSGCTRNVARPSTSLRSSRKPFIRGVPRLHHDEVQFVAQKVVDHILVAVFDFEKIGQHAYRSHPAIHCSRLEQPAHRLGRISVLGDDRFQRTFLADQAGIFRAQGIEMLLAVRLGARASAPAA